MSELIRVFETGVLPIIQEYVRWQIYKDIASDVAWFIVMIGGLIILGVGVKYIWTSTEDDDLRINRRDR